jgi:hypothetical protein
LWELRKRVKAYISSLTISLKIRHSLFQKFVQMGSNVLITWGFSWTADSEKVKCGVRPKGLHFSRHQGFADAHITNLSATSEVARNWRWEEKGSLLQSQWQKKMF